MTGTPPNVAFSGGDKDVVNLNSRAVHVEIPLLSTMFRGRTYEWKYVFDSPTYSMVFFPYPGTNPSPPGNWAVQTSPRPTSSGNWNIESTVGGATISYEQDPDTTVTCETMNNVPTLQGTYHWLHGYRLLDANNTSHPLSLATLVITLQEEDEATGVVCPQEKVHDAHVHQGYTLDGTGYYVDLDGGSITDSDGGVQSITVTGENIQESAFQDANGNLTPGAAYVTQNSPSYTPASLSLTDPMGNAQTIGLQYVSVPLQTAFCGDVTIHRLPPGGLCEDLPASTRSMLSRITLPDGTFYSFTYTQNGLVDLASMTLPTGGTVTYTYDTALNSTSSTPRYGTVYVHSQVATRSLNDLSTTSQWTYSSVVGGGTTVTTVQAPDGNCEVHTSGVGQLGTARYSPVETLVQKQVGCGTNAIALDTVQTDYLFDYANDPIPNSVQYVVNARPIRVTHTLATGLSSKVETDYAAITRGLSTIYLGPSEIREFAYGSSAPALTRDYTYLHQVGSSAGTATSYLAANLINKVVSTTQYVGPSSSDVIASQQQNEYDVYTAGITPRPTAVWHNASYSPTYTMRGNVTAVNRIGSASQMLTTRYQYDELGNRVLITDPRSYSTQLFYDDAFADSACLPSNGSLYSQNSKTIDALGHETDRTFSSCWSSVRSMRDANDLSNGRAGTVMTYDSLARLHSVTYPDGSVAQTVITASAPLQATLSRSALADTNYFYDGLGKVTDEQRGGICPAGTVGHRTTSYDSLGRVSMISDPFCGSDTGHGTTTSAYDPIGRLATVTTKDAAVERYCYDGASSTSGTTCTGLGTSMGQTSEVIDPSGRSTKRVTDAKGRLIEVDEDPAGANLQTLYSYDVLGNLIGAGQSGANGETVRTRSFGYDSFSRLLTSSNPETGTTCYGQIIGGLCTSGYDGNGNLLAKTDARGITTSYTYDPLNRLYAKSYFNSTGRSTGDPSVFVQYDRPATGGSDLNPVGRMTLEWTGPSSTAPLSSTSDTSVPAGFLTSTVFLSHDPMGRVNSEQQCPFAPCYTAYQFSYLYDLAGDLTQWNNGIPVSSTSSSTGLIWTASYNGAARLSGLQTSTQPWAFSSTYPSQLVNLSLTGTTPSYDAPGHIVNEQAAIYPSNSGSPGLILTNAYDNRGRIVSEVGQGQVISSAASQSVGFISVTGTEAAPIVLQAAAGSTTFSVTGADATHVVCPTRPTRPGAPIPPCVTVPDSGSLSVTVNGFSSTVTFDGTSKDSSIAAGIASGFNVSWSPVSATSTGSTVTVTANTTGTASNYPISFSNLDGFVFSDPNAALGGGQNGIPTYDSGTLTATITNTSVTPNVIYTSSPVSWGQGMSIAPLSTSLAAAINAAAGSLVTASASGSTIKLMSVGTGAATNYTVSVSSVDTAPSTFPAASFNAQATNMSGGAAAVTGNGTVYSYVVPSGGYEANSNLHTHSDSVMGTWNFGYDNLNRLTSGNAASGPYAGLWGCWAYDSFGNRTMQVFQSGLCSTATPTAKYNANNQVTFAGQEFPSSLSAPNGFTYDPSGSGNVWFDGQNNYLYDGEGRVCAVQNTITSAMAAYIYDASGTRVAKGSITSWNCNLAANGFTLTHQYLLGLGGEQVTELSGTGAWLHSNVWAGSHLDATYDPKGLHFHLADPLGSRRVQLNAQGAVEETCQSLPFGDALQCAQTSIPSADDATEHHFTGKERDTESGLDYFGARYYASSMGRWLSPDKPFADQHAQNPQSWNLYAYARNNPLTVFDPNGEAAVVLVNGNNVTIYLPVSFSGNANTPANQAAYTAAITSAWTGQFGNYNTTMHVVPGDPGGPLTNDVHINAATPADGAFPRPTTDVGGPNMNLFGLGDNAAQNNYETWASGHETGHSMGEQDQYHDATGPNPGYEHNIMGAVNGTPDARDINNVLAFHGNTVINITPSTPVNTETTTVNQTIPLIQPQQLQLQPRNVQQ